MWGRGAGALLAPATCHRREMDGERTLTAAQSVWKYKTSALCDTFWALPFSHISLCSQAAGDPVLEPGRKDPPRVWLGRPS